MALQCDREWRKCNLYVRNTGWAFFLKQIWLLRGGDGHYVICRFTTGMAENLHKHRVAHEILRAMPMAQTVADYNEIFNHIELLLRRTGVGIFMRSQSYSPKLTFRAYMLSKCARAGVHRLRFSNNSFALAALKCFPDENGYVGNVAKALNSKHDKVKLQSMMKALSYKGPPKLLTCFLRLVGEVQHHTLASIQAWNVGQARRQLQRLHRGRQSHPGSVIKHLVKKQK